MKFFFLFFSASLAILPGCGNMHEAKLPDATEVLHKNEKHLTELIIYDIFSPPVAARIYAYTSLAAHEAIRFLDDKEFSITSKLNGFPEMPQPQQGKDYDYVLAASVAFYSVMREMTFSKDTITRFENETYAPFKQILNEETYNNSVEFGKAISGKIMERAKADNYKETRAMEKYFGSEQDGKWRPTSPDYLDGVEPHWMKVKAMSLDSSSQFDPGPPPVFSKDPVSLFYKMNKEVFETVNNLSKEQQDIAYFWDDNPFVSHHKGHLMYNTKKQTPGGHWMGITTIACRKSKSDAIKTAKAYALVAVSLLDGFISCWDTKYRYQYIRPVTVINDWFSKSWESNLQTPPFPEYTSGHSTISASAATVLTAIFGDNFSFHDDADKEYIGMERDFTSFQQAALEASLSRLYGGIHYRISLDKGNDCGKKIGAFILKKIEL
jgi:hypothetical protein